ncbi:protein cueball-like [Phlebotomus argentipes]|uniref:protein cueball-like n=1 Tax=Phlebotomus argentipes TaxID=94469 RepID=UPI002892A9F8|nr:protein cueball-like [Phlebotomus argentipes]
MWRRLIILVIIFTICVLAFSGLEACELDQTQYGCRIDNRQCTCAYGCRSEFRYLTRKECQDALKGRSGDICSANNPCLNRGACIQVSQMPGYKCRCEGTGYWGNRCQLACPEARHANFPYECIVI